MPKWKMIGIRVPEKSNLPTRLKEISEKNRLSYCELLEKFITQAEFDIKTPVPNFEAKDIIALQALIEKFSDLKLQIDEIEGRLKVLEKPVNHGNDAKLLQRSDTLAAAHSERVQETGKPYLNETNESEPLEPRQAHPEYPEKNTNQPDGIEFSNTIGGESKENVATIAYIRRLSTEGLSLRKIAERLNAEERATISGLGVWNHGMVHKILATAPK